jgi:hypothetical protein
MATNSIVKALCLAAVLALVQACGGAGAEPTAAMNTADARLSPAPVADFTPATACGPDNCVGCCTDSGVCKGGGLPMFCGKGGVACEACDVLAGERCGVCSGITACYFHNDPLCQPGAAQAAKSR